MVALKIKNILLGKIKQRAETKTQLNRGKYKQIKARYNSEVETVQLRHRRTKCKPQRYSSKCENCIGNTI